MYSFDADDSRDYAEEAYWSNYCGECDGTCTGQHDEPAPCDRVGCLNDSQIGNRFCSDECADVVNRDSDNYTLCVADACDCESDDLD